VPTVQLECLNHTFPGFDLENISSQNMHVIFSSFFVPMSEVDFFQCFFDFDPHVRESLFERLGPFGFKVGFLFFSTL
jgi:hypothetical protein